MEPLLSNSIVILVVLLILILLIAWWLATRNRVPVLNCDTVLPPEACDPNWLDGVRYVPLSQLPAKECDNRLLDPGGGRCTMFTYTNKGQKFTLTVEGGDESAVRDYINNAAVYFTARKIGTKPRTEIPLPSLTAILIETVMLRTKLSRRDLNAARAQMEDNQVFVTLADILGSVFEDPARIEQILETAISRAVEEYKAAGVDAGAVPSVMTALFYEPGATFLTDPTTLPHDRASDREYLINHPISLIVTLDWASAPKKETNDSWVVWFSIDPPARTIAAGETVEYRTKESVRGASSGIRATEGSMTNNFWRSGGDLGEWSDSRTADKVSNPRPPSMRNNVSPKKCDYHSTVTGGPDGGKYTISGGWRE